MVFVDHKVDTTVDLLRSRDVFWAEVLVEASFYLVDHWDTSVQRGRTLEVVDLAADQDNPTLIFNKYSISTNIYII